MPIWPPHDLSQATQPQAEQRNDVRGLDRAPEPAGQESAPWTSAADPGLRPALAELDRLAELEKLAKGAEPGLGDAGS
jgi:hypothetical protein